MERCTICGSELPCDAQFCGACGRLVSTMRELPTRLMGYQTVEMQEEDGPTVVTRPSNPGLHSGIQGDVTIRHTWSDKDTPSHNLSPLADEDDDEEEEERRRALFLGIPLPGGLTKGSNVPMVQGTPQFSGVPMVQGNPVLPGAISATQGLQNAASIAPPPFSPLAAPMMPSPAVPNPGSWPQHPTVPTGSPPHSNPVGKGSGSKGKPGTGNPGNSGCGLIMLIVAAVIVIIIGALGGLFFGLPPAISLVGSSAVVSGGVLHLHGNNFVPGSAITLTLDNNLPLFATGNGANTAQRHVGNTHDLSLSLLEIASSPTPIRAGATGSFDITMPVSPTWSLGKHTIRAAEAVSSRSTTLTFTIGATTPTLVVKPAVLDFGTLEVGSKAILSVVVNNSGQQPLNWQASVGDAAWLSLQSTSGAVQGNGTPQFIYVTGDASKLKVGTYKATLHINSNGGNALVNVQLVVAPQSPRPTAKLSVTPTTLDFGSLDSSTQLTRSVAIGNTGTAALNWTVDNGTANWVILDTLSQTIQPGAQPDTLNVTVDTTNLAAGTHNATLTINSNGGKAQVAITVVVNVPPQPCVLQVPSSTSLTFNATMGSNPKAQSFTVGATGNCTGGVTITPTVSLASGSGWLAVTPSMATITGGNTTFTVNVTSSALAPGSYSGSISLAAVSNGAAISGSPQTVSVSLTVTEVPPVLSVSPGKLPISVTNGDSATTYAITITNTGGAALQWNATLDANAPSFVTLSFGTNTTLAAGASTTVTVNVNPNNQPAGTYSATVTVTAVDPITGKAVTNSPATTAVSITITAQPALQLKPTSLTFTPGSCVYTDSGTVSLTNSGGGTLNWNVGTPVYTSGSGWLTVKPSGNGSGNATLTFSADGTQLTQGQTYTATVTITPSVGNAQTVSVSFTVAVCIS
ncbi:MAG: BACON domain-containing protein [Ktedonobacteraceae bacterium]